MGEVVDLEFMRNISNDLVVHCTESELIDVINDCLGLSIHIKDLYKDDKFVGVCVSAFYFDDPYCLDTRLEVIAQLTSNAMAERYQDKLFSGPVEVAVLIMSLYAEQRDMYDECIA